METALQTAIAKLKEDVKYYDGLLENAYKYHPNDVFQFKCNARAAEATIKSLTELLPKEREQIENSYKADLYPCSDEDAANYYETNFNK